MSLAVRNRPGFEHAKEFLLRVLFEVELLHVADAVEFQAGFDAVVGKYTEIFEINSVGRAMRLRRNKYDTRYVA